jgi:release factor glutamine methyltransferase
MSQRSEGKPLAYLLGHREFHGLRLRVTPDVLDPRPDTETLVEWALSLMAPLSSPLSSPLSAHPPAPHWEPPVGRPSADAASAPGAFHGARVLDLGTGSGAVALALKHSCPEADMHATDASAAALAVARGNAAELGLAVTFHEGSWWQAVGGLRFDVVVSNPPYIREDDPHLAALLHEPRAALVAGEQGLADIRAIIEGARGHLNLGAWLLLEHGFDQGPAVAALLRDAGFVEIDHRLDLAGHTRCTGGRLPR